ncbi:hypothetical protein VTJ83DRAFT_2437 [Remersonia thermophila]|uniref:Glycoside hydrolase 131 catalytic N-terminal domain-containing protein n=1 Tax=Remersonia thermophila TaxID=72144 RepID=A0ABR4DIR4_9PEZI
MHGATLLSLLAAGLASVTAAPSCKAPSGNDPVATPAGEIKCPVVFDGRLPASAALTDFDSYSTSLFNAEYVKGNNLKWSEIIKFPSALPAARFDHGDDHKPFEVTISDQSIFMQQRGFRRAGLQFQGDTNNGSPGSRGVKTLHFSLRWDNQRPLNLSHEYLLTWHETAAYDANQFNFEAGAIIGQSNLPRDTYKVLDRNNRQVWSTPILKDAWQNFAIRLDFDRNTLQVFYSQGNEPLKSVTNAVYNNNAGEGQYQIGILKKPTGTSDVVNSGYQSPNLDEGLIYGSLFVEDSANNCISL